MDSNRDFSQLTVAVVGLGLMGGSFAKRLKEIGNFVIGINRTQAVAEEALAMGIVDSISESDLKKADIVIFCTPEKGTLAFIKNKLSLLKKDALLTDIAGVKNHFAKDVQVLLPDGMDFISGHPMCGREGAGLAQADGHIFDGANYVVIPQKENKKDHIQLISDMAKALGCKHIPVVTAEEHDRAIAYTSDLTHVVATALIHSESYNKDTKYFMGGSFRDMTRVADINGKLWTSLFLSNQQKLLDEIDRFSASLAELKAAIAEGDSDAMEAFLNEAGRRRRELMYHEDSEG